VQAATEKFGSLLRQIVATVDEHGVITSAARSAVEDYFDTLSASSPGPKLRTPAGYREWLFVSTVSQDYPLR
jgi:hypothetical protein